RLRPSRTARSSSTIITRIFSIALTLSPAELQLVGSNSSACPLVRTEHVHAMTGRADIHLSGTLNVKHVPWPGDEAILIFPPSCATRARMFFRPLPPRPLPEN